MNAPVLEVREPPDIDPVVGGDVVVEVAAQDAGLDDGDFDVGEMLHGGGPV